MELKEPTTTRTHRMHTSTHTHLCRNASQINQQGEKRSMIRLRVASEMVVISVFLRTRTTPLPALFLLPTSSSSTSSLWGWFLDLDSRNPHSLTFSESLAGSFSIIPTSTDILLQKREEFGN
ncbi:hypothetical protein MLD38_027004 [Melastoma candidum]|uniref:Uncharacterized protein n=1 Tax=Melastoma candidum TaxID=119954 RepID=A0ACB9P1W8_9MYRT|nr:hypothetical protein MLD38_027004 [Melastoma candidum]